MYHKTLRSFVRADSRAQRNVSAARETISKYDGILCDDICAAMRVDKLRNRDIDGKMETAIGVSLSSQM